MSRLKCYSSFTTQHTYHLHTPPCLWGGSQGCSDSDNCPTCCHRTRSCRRQAAWCTRPCLGGKESRCQRPVLLWQLPVTVSAASLVMLATSLVISATSLVMSATSLVVSATSLAVSYQSCYISYKSCCVDFKLITAESLQRKKLLGSSEPLPPSRI